MKHSIHVTLVAPGATPDQLKELERLYENFKPYAMQLMNDEANANAKANGYLGPEFELHADFTPASHHHP